MIKLINVIDNNIIFYLLIVLQVFLITPTLVHFFRSIQSQILLILIENMNIKRYGMADINLKKTHYLCNEIKINYFKLNCIFHTRCLLYRSVWHRSQISETLLKIRRRNNLDHTEKESHISYLILIWNIITQNYLIGFVCIYVPSKPQNVIKTLIERIIYNVERIGYVTSKADRRFYFLLKNVTQILKKSINEDISRKLKITRSIYYFRNARIWLVKCTTPSC